MLDDAHLSAFLLDEIRDRLPLYESEVVTVSGQRVVRSSYVDGVKVFIPFPVIEQSDFTSKSLRALVDVMAELSERSCSQFFLVFIDTGGSLSFYQLNTLHA